MLELLNPQIRSLREKPRLHLLDRLPFPRQTNLEILEAAHLRLDLLHLRLRDGDDQPLDLPLLGVGQELGANRRRRQPSRRRLPSPGVRHGDVRRGPLALAPAAAAVHVHRVAALLRLLVLLVERVERSLSGGGGDARRHARRQESHVGHDGVRRTREGHGEVVRSPHVDVRPAHAPLLGGPDVPAAPDVRGVRTADVGVELVQEALLDGQADEPADALLRALRAHVRGNLRPGLAVRLQRLEEEQSLLVGPVVLFHLGVRVVVVLVVLHLNLFAILVDRHDPGRLFRLFTRRPRRDCSKEAAARGTVRELTSGEAPPAHVDAPDVRLGQTRRRSRAVIIRRALAGYVRVASHARALDVALVSVQHRVRRERRLQRG